MRTFEITYTVQFPGDLSSNTTKESVRANDPGVARRLIEARYPAPIRVEIKHYQEIK